MVRAHHDQLGVAAALTGLIRTQGQFYSARFFLGVAEAGFAPGMIVYITHWFRAQDRAKALAVMFLGYPIAQILGAPLSAALLSIHWLGLAGWRWVLIFEGLPAVLAGVLVFRYLPDRPDAARWLKVEEQDWITSQLEEEKRALNAGGSSAWRAMIQPQVLVLTAIWFFSVSAGNAFTLWLPKFVQGLSGFSAVTTALVATIPFLAALPMTMFVGWNSDRTGERRWHVSGSMCLAAAGLALSQATQNVWVGIFALTVAAMGSAARQAPFWSVSSSVLAGTLSAVAIGTISSFGQLGSFLSPYIIGFLTDRTGTYHAGTIYLIGSYVAAAVLMLFLKTSQPVRSVATLG